MSKHPHLHENEVILEIKDLRVAYGKVEALHGVDLTIRCGEIVTVIGPNGAGKTTLLAALMGLLPATGEKFEEATDFSTGGAIQLRIDRRYRSLGEDGDRFGLLGTKWRLPWDAALEVYPTQQTLIFTMADDSLFSLQPDVNGIYRPTNAPNWDIKGVHITTAPEAYEISDENDTVYRFETTAG